MAPEVPTDPAVLRTLQLVETTILAEFDRVCRKLDIPYVVYGGTAIGAVRHQGFIPWDDDVDVCMAREDYERFLAEAPSELGADFEIHNSRTHKDFPNMFTNLVLKETLFIPEFIKDSTYRMPIGLDIFPLDNVPRDKKAYQRQSRATWFWGRMLYLQGTPAPYLEVGGVLRKAILSATFVIYWTLRLARVKPRALQQRWEKAARRYEHAEMDLMADFTDRTPLAWSVTHDDLYPSTDVPFENITVKLPRAYDKILMRGYGDYMQLPPEDKRKTHLPVVIDFGKFGAEESR